MRVKKKSAKTLRKEKKAVHQQKKVSLESLQNALQEIGVESPSISRSNDNTQKESYNEINNEKHSTEAETTPESISKKKRPIRQNMRESQRSLQRDKVDNNRKNLRRQEKYKNDKLHRERILDANRNREKMYKESRSKRDRERYNKDKQSIKTRAKERYQNCKVLKEKRRKKYQLNKEFREKCKQMSKLRSIKKSNSKKEIDNVIRAFRQTCREAPEYVCCVCHRLMFRKSVKQCKPDEMHTDTQLKNKCITTTYLHKCDNMCAEPCEIRVGPLGNLWICVTCKTHLSKGQIPPEAQANSLSLQEIPDELTNFNSLEQQLVSLAIPFAKIVSLPKGGQPGIKGPVICCPNDVQSTQLSLPRTLAEADVVPIRLKRKLEYKGHVNYKMVNTRKIMDGLCYLQEQNPFYADVTFNTDLVDVNTELTEGEADEGVDSNELNEKENTAPIDEEVDTDEKDHVGGIGNDTCLQPIDMQAEALALLKDGVFCIAPCQGKKPQSMFRPGDDDIEAKAFPTLFPTGQNTFKTDREKTLTITKYFNARLLGADTRFASSPDYIFLAQYVKEIDQLLSSISIAMRKGSTHTQDNRKVTAEMLMNNDEISQMLKRDIAYRHMVTIRGSPDYWKKTMNDLFAMIRQLGIPTWFCTFSAAEISRWPEIIETIERQKGNTVVFESLEWHEKCEILRSNPVTVARMFDHRVSDFFTNVIKSPAHPIGKVIDYFFRVEFQMRGAPHLHCLIWCENAPKLDVDDDKTVTEFVDRYVSCQLPKPDIDAELHEMVQSVQMHRKTHTKSCHRGKKICRFNFPKCVAKETFISRSDPDLQTDDTDDTDDNDGTDTTTMTKTKAKKLLSNLYNILNTNEHDAMTFDELIESAGFSSYDEFQTAHSKVSDTTEIIMKRQPGDVWINPYNPDLLRAWNANMDIQFIRDAYSCVMYIVSYISKAEHELGEILTQAQKDLAEDGSNNHREQMKKIGSVYFDKREVSVQESVVRTCSIRMKESSRNVVFVPTDNNAKLSKPLLLLQAEADSPDQENVWMTSLEDRYKARPLHPDFNSMCQADFASKYRILTKVEGEKLAERSHVHQLQNGLGFIAQRTSGNNAVIRFAKFSQSSNEEKHFQRLIKLYLPFRKDEETRPAGFPSYKIFYETGAVKLDQTTVTQPVALIVEENRIEYEKTSAVLEKVVETFETIGPLEDAWSKVSPESEIQRLESRNEQEPENDALRPESIPELQSRENQVAKALISVEWTTDAVRPLLRMLNNKQREVLNFVRDWCIQESNGEKPKPFYLHVTGGAGTGKSHLIKCIYHEAGKLLKNQSNPDDVSILLTAPTGTAAFNICGFTIHSSLKIPRITKYVYEPLGNDALNTLQSNLSGLKILIIDEISMVDRKVLAYVHGRLRQVKHMNSTNPAIFGGVCIIAVGDFYQLPPVRAKTVCVPDSRLVTDLWHDNFEKIELTEIMRQKDDASFANMLNTMRTKSKTDQIDPEIDQALKERNERNDIPLDALHIFSTNNSVAEHNASMLSIKCQHPQNIEAIDFLKNPTNGVSKRLETACLGTPDDLSTCLSIGTDSRVMLLRNIDVSDGLVNGAFGTVTDIICDDKQEAKTVFVNFDSDRVGRKKSSSKGVPIERVNEVMSKQKSTTRQQFPIRLAWAATIHKVQGMTVDQIVYDMKGTFSNGQAYVAMSRCTSINGLFLKNYDPKLIYRADDVHKSLQKMKLFQSNVLPTEDHNAAFIFAHQNVHGLRSKVPDFRANRLLTHIDALACTETWLTPEIRSEKVALPSFDMCRNDRPGGHGGVCIYTTEKLLTAPLNFPSRLEMCAIQVSTLEYPSIVYVSIYRPPTQPLRNFIPQLQDMLYMLDDHAVPNVIVTGDFNENQLSESHHPISETFANYGYRQTCNEVTTCYGSLIDLVFVKLQDFTETTQVEKTYYSDHDLVVVKLFYDN